MKSILLISCTCWLANGTALNDEQAKKQYSFVDLTKHFTLKLTEKFGNDDREGNFLTLSKRQKKFGSGLYFNIKDGVIQLGSKVLVEQPEKVAGIKVNRKFVKLYILHATGYGGGPNVKGTAWHVEDNTPIGAYRIQFEDKSVETIPIVYGKDVRDWWFRDTEKKTSRSQVVWTGDNELAKKYGCRLRLYMTAWENPKPDVTVIAIDYTALKDKTVAAPFCVGMTLELGPRSKAGSK